MRPTIREKDGKEHRYWSLVENKRVSGGRVAQRHVLYLGEINSSRIAVMDRLLAHKQAVFDHLVGRWRDLFNVSFDVLLYLRANQREGYALLMKAVL